MLLHEAHVGFNFIFVKVAWSRDYEVTFLFSSKAATCLRIPAKFLLPATQPTKCILSATQLSKCLLPPFKVCACVQKFLKPLTHVMRVIQRDTTCCINTSHFHNTAHTDEKKLERTLKSVYIIFKSLS